MLERYTLIGFKNQKQKSISVEANNITHAQAQCDDISRALQLESFYLEYSSCKESDLSNLFKKLAHNDFHHAECEPWEGSWTNGAPVIYAFGVRYYARNLMLDYMDIKRDSVVKMSCKSKECINPYHFSYKTYKASKLSSGDKKMMLAFRSQGVSIPQIAKALKVHRSTIYRILKDERLSSGSKDHRHSTSR